MLPLALAVVQTGFAFGVTGAYTVSIRVDGHVSARGAAPAHRRVLTREELADLNRVVFETAFATLPARTRCRAGAPQRFVRVGPRVVRVDGACSARFDRLWATLARYALRRQSR
jgi:hypothetical protein